MKLLHHLRHLRFRLRTAELLTLVSILVLWSAGLSVAYCRRFPAALDRTERANVIYTAWNDMAGSMTEENKLLDELQENLKQNPPESVFDSRRPELYRLAIAEHQRQLKALQTMQSADK